MVDQITDMILGLTRWAQSSALLLAVFLFLRWCFKKKISRRLQYALWIVVALRLLIPTALITLPGTWTSPAPGTLAREIPILYSWDGEGFAQGTTIHVWEGMAQWAAVDYTEAHQMAESIQEQPLVNDRVLIWDVMPHLSSDYSIIFWILLFWGIGSLLLGSVVLLSNVIFYLRLRKVRIPYQKIECSYPVYVVRGIGSSCVFGLIRPAIYLTEEVVADGELCVSVLEHEVCHCRRKDHWWALVRSLCLILHWYDPLVWLAVACHRTDMELACDEAVVSKKESSERILYGKHLLQLANRSGVSGMLFCVILPVSRKGNSIKKRILYIAQPSKITKAAAAFALMTCLVLGACSFTKVGKYETDIFSVPGTYCVVKDQDIVVNYENTREVSVRDEFSLQLWEGFDYYAGGCNGVAKQQLSIYYQGQLVGFLQPYEYERDPYYLNKRTEMDQSVEEMGIVLSKEGENVVKGYLNGLWSDGVMTVDHRAEDGTGYSHRYYFFCTDDIYTYVFWVRADFEVWDHLMASVASLQLENSEETVLLRENRDQFYAAISELLSKDASSEYGCVSLDEEYGFIYPPGISCESCMTEAGREQLILYRDEAVIGGLNVLYYDAGRHSALNSMGFMEESGIYPYRGDMKGTHTALLYSLVDQNYEEYIQGEVPLMIRVESTERSPFSYCVDHFLYYVGGEDGRCYDLWLDMSVLTEEEMKWFLIYGLWNRLVA